MIKSILYLSIALALFAGYYTGANMGYDMGAIDGVHNFILKGIDMDLVECHYKKECKKNECKLPIHPKKKSTFDDLLRGR